MPRYLPFCNICIFLGETEDFDIYLHYEGGDRTLYAVGRWGTSFGERENSDLINWEPWRDVAQRTVVVEPASQFPQGL